MKGVKLLIGCVGDQFMPGVKEAIAAAAEGLRDAGATVDVKVQPPITVLPFFGLATMRNRLTMMGFEQGYTHVALLDNDVKPQPASLVNLLRRRNSHIVIPTYSAGPATVLYQPSNAGAYSRVMATMEWAVFSCIMFNRLFLRHFPAPFADTFCYCEEETTCQRWRLAGYSLTRARLAFMDLLRPPTNLWEMKPDEMFRLKTPGDVTKGSIR